MKRLSFLLVTLAACAGTQEEPIKPIPGLAPAPASKPAPSGDVSFEVPVANIKGLLLEPSALGRPGMPLTQPKKKTTIEKQRALVASTKDIVLKQGLAAQLASMIYLDAKANKDREKALLIDARQVLRDVAQQAGDAVDELTLQLLANYELYTDELAASEKAWAALIAKDPKAKDVVDHRTWYAYTLLKQGKNAEALAVVAGEKLDDKHPELAYILAWAKLRTGDAAGAWPAIQTAVRTWGSNGNRDDLERDMFLIAARAGLSLDAASGPVLALLAKSKPQQYEMIAKLGLQGYGPGGRWAEAIAALDKAFDLAGDTLPPNYRPVMRISQANFAVRLDSPDVAAKYGLDTVKALAACGGKCSEKDTADYIQSMFLMGRLFHVLFATANDQRYYQPAHDLYLATIPLLPEASRGQAQRDAAILETTLKNIKAGTGTHDKGGVGALLGHRDTEVQVCYEIALGANPALAGTLGVELEVDASGVVKGVSTEPKAGQADLAAVAGCVAERAKQWKLPKRGMPGTTRIKLSYNLAIKK